MRISDNRIDKIVKRPDERSDLNLQHCCIMVNKVSLSSKSAVSIRREPTDIPTYEAFPPNKNPMFLEKRVYQGSSGRVYPLPCVERFAEKKSKHLWDAITIENEFIEVTILPELGGRIHGAKDKTNGYDFVYRNGVIKPALIALSGSWISGGIEFNWPQHHRPSTFMPTDVEIEEHADGSKTIWMSEHDPLNRMKGMHGICIHPGRAVIELKVRAYNRTPLVQTFLWWANVAVRANEGYQSFLPPDVTHVADHAKGSTSTFPRCDGVYYGIDYAKRAAKGVPVAERPPHFVPPHCIDDPQKINPKLQGLDYAPNDLSWYANIPVPTSYMCLGSKEDFFGGYDHLKGAGIVHVANHHISPGKKQWVWGNHNFGYAWDRNLTDDSGPYVELMSGVYTDNQPDFSFLQPGETKTWSQFWYPIQGIGPAQKASVDAALSLTLRNGEARIGAITTSSRRAVVRLELVGTDGAAKVFFSESHDLAPNRPLVTSVEVPPETKLPQLRLALIGDDGREILQYRPVVPQGNKPEVATEPPAPASIESVEELYITGLHLSQYRHPTRMPEPYWEEALRRDPSDARTNNIVGRATLINGEFAKAEKHFRTAIARLTRRNPNPYDGEPFYNLGLTLRYQAISASLANNAERATELNEAAYTAFYKATWNQAWQSAGYHALAEMDASRGDWTSALDHVDRSLRVNTDNLQARNLQAMVLRRVGRCEEADAILRATVALDPLDWWARHLLGESIGCDTKTRLDLAHECARAGFYVEALELIAPDAIADTLKHRPEPTDGTLPMLAYTRASFHQLLGATEAAKGELESAQAASRDYCFPSRIEDIVILEWAIAQDPQDPRAPYYLGNLFYDRKRHQDAIVQWDAAAKLEYDNPTVWRNLGIAYYNVLEDQEKARIAYERAYSLAFADGGTDARLLFERDLLWKRMATSSAKRLAMLEEHLAEVRSRDDLSVEYLDLLNQEGRHEDALAYIASRRFQPWEGGEGLARGQHVRTHLALGRKALAAGDHLNARRHFEAALESPLKLAESKHLLANQSEIYYWLGCAYEALGGEENLCKAQDVWTAAAAFRGDFQERAVRTYSEMTYFSALSLQKLGKKTESLELFRSLREYAKRLFKEEAKVYYFATSLPARLLFENLQRRQETTSLLIEAQANLGLGNIVEGRQLLEQVIQRDPARALAKDLINETNRQVGIER